MSVVRTTEAQDFLDGAALRRLREAGAMRVWVEQRDDQPFRVDVDTTEGVISIQFGATLAEAADRCREVLMGVSRNG